MTHPTAPNYTTATASYRKPGWLGFKRDTVVIAKSSNPDLLSALQEEAAAIDAAVQARHGSDIEHGEAEWV
jgi:hypothetical protein